MAVLSSLERGLSTLYPAFLLEYRVVWGQGKTLAQSCDPRTVQAATELCSPTVTRHGSCPWLIACRLLCYRKGTEHTYIHTHPCRNTHSTNHFGGGGLAQMEAGRQDLNNSGVKIYIISRPTQVKEGHSASCYLLDYSQHHLL